MPAATTEKSHLHQRQSSGDALSIAFELVATPALFGFFGWLIDGAVGTRPAFTLGLCLVTACYTGWKTFKLYGERMDALDAQLPSRRAEARQQDADG